MANQCPICSKFFDSKLGLKSHTGTSNSKSRQVHIRGKCDKKFCSQRAMEQHRDAPDHNTMFPCDVCKKPFGSKQAIAQHRKSESHTKILNRNQSTHHSAENPDNVSSGSWMRHNNPDTRSHTVRLPLPVVSLVQLDQFLPRY